MPAIILPLSQRRQEVIYGELVHSIIVNQPSIHPFQSRLRTQRPHLKKTGLQTKSKIYSLHLDVLSCVILIVFPYEVH